MIIARVGRGIGNCMYIYAAALALAEHHKTELKLDTTYLKSWPKFKKTGGSWKGGLVGFNISAKEATPKELRKFVIKTKFRPIDKLLEKYRLFEKNVYRFGTHEPMKKFFRLPNNIYLLGYFGHEKFSKSIKERIKKEFELKEEYKKNIKNLLEEILSCNSVGIHVRRTDIFKMKNYYMLGLDYYKKAIEIINEKIKNPIFYVFSDDIDWCKKNLKFDGPSSFVEGNKGYEDFELMRNCKHNILANSAMSWWVGYLNENPNKIVITPKHFAQFKHLQTEKDFLPKEWIKL